LNVDSFVSDLGYNFLRWLPSKLFTAKVHVESNPLTCDCRLKRVARRARIAPSASAVCAGPAKFKDRKIDAFLQFAAKELKCDWGKGLHIVTVRLGIGLKCCAVLNR
jgi:hypothetical protein